MFCKRLQLNKMINTIIKQKALIVNEYLDLPK
jgi:hypothetical protein